MKKLLIAPMILLVLFVFSMGCEPVDPEEPYPPPNFDHDFGEMTDSRDGQTYKTIEIGSHTWLAENLNYETDNSWCFYDDPNNCDTYGRLYNWDAAKTVCPPGWKLPSDNDWQQLVDLLGGSSVAGGKMKSTSSLWACPNTGATNESGFSALPGAVRYSSGYFGSLGRRGSWWSSTERDEYNSRSRYLRYNGGNVNRYTNYKAHAFSVRCVRN